MLQQCVEFFHHSSERLAFAWRRSRSSRCNCYFHFTAPSFQLIGPVVVIYLNASWRAAMAMRGPRWWALCGTSGAPAVRIILLNSSAGLRSPRARGLMMTGSAHIAPTRPYTRGGSFAGYNINLSLESLALEKQRFGWGPD